MHFANWSTLRVQPQPMIDMFKKSIASAVLLAATFMPESVEPMPDEMKIPAGSSFALSMRAPVERRFIDFSTAFVFIANVRWGAGVLDNACGMTSWFDFHALYRYF